MKTFKANAGPFQERPHYKIEEIERICTEELRAAGYYPPRPQAIRIDRFLEKRFGLEIQYESLSEGILGYTVFGPKGAVAVVVSRQLDEEATQVAERRIRTTLAHEVGHILLQGHLFGLPGAAGSLFSRNADVTETKVLCRQDSTSKHRSVAGYGYDSKWWEYQANRAIGALLLPRPLVLTHLEPLLSGGGTFRIKILEPERQSQAVAALVAVFNISPVVARLRLDELWPAAQAGQLRL